VYRQCGIVDMKMYLQQRFHSGWSLGPTRRQKQSPIGSFCTKTQVCMLTDLYIKTATHCSLVPIKQGRVIQKLKPRVRLPAFFVLYMRILLQRGIS
jgi:hypothetical protein